MENKAVKISSALLIFFPHIDIATREQKQNQKQYLKDLEELMIPILCFWAHVLFNVPINILSVLSFVIFYCYSNCEIHNKKPWSKTKSCDQAEF